jgi:nitrous oxidase accessory protein NosD
MNGLHFRAIQEYQPCAVLNSNIHNNQIGIVSSDDSKNILIKNNKIWKNSEFGVCAKKGSLTVIDNQIEKNHTGVMLFEYSSLLLSNNRIMKNDFWGVSIRYEVDIKQFDNNIITHNQVIGKIYIQSYFFRGFNQRQNFC